MRHMIYLVEELSELFTDPVRFTVAVCANQEIAQHYIYTHGGNQLMMSNSGLVLPKYKITETQMLCDKKSAEV